MFFQSVILLVVQIFFIELTAAQNFVNTNKSLTSDLLNEDYKVYYSKKEINTRLLNFLKSKLKIDLKLTDPDEEFNRTDIFIDGFPNNRLVIVGKGANQTNFILYEHGGNAPYNACLIYSRINNRNYNILCIRLNAEVRTLENLSEAIRSSDFLTLYEYPVSELQIKPTILE